MNIYKKIKARERLITTIKPINKNSDKENNSDKEGFKDNISKIIKFFSNKKPLFDSLDNKKLKLFFSFFLYRSQYVLPNK